MERMSTMMLMLEHQERQIAPFLACQMSKWFNDTSISTALEQPAMVHYWRA
jgi:hypothetical protein